MTRITAAIKKYLRQRKEAFRFGHLEDARGRRGKRYCWKQLASAALTGMLHCVAGLRSLQDDLEEMGAVARSLGLKLGKIGRWALGNFLMNAEKEKQPELFREAER